MKTLPTSLAALLLVVTIIPHAVAQHTDQVRLIGLHTVSEENARSWIAPQLEIVAERGVSSPRADDLAFFLETAMVDRGYDSAQVNWQLNQGQIQLSVEEGATYNVNDFTVSGNHALATEAIEELLLAATRKRLRLKPDDTVPYVIGDIKKGLVQVLDLYELLGYISAKADLNEVSSSGGRSLQLSVVEGERHLVGRILSTAAKTPEIEQAFSEIQEKETERPLSPTILLRLKTQYREAAVDHGFYNAEVAILRKSSEIRVVEGISSRVVDLFVQVDWGNLVEIDQFVVTGNDKVDSRLFEKQLASIVGKPYSPRETNKTIESLLRTGAFKSIRTELIEGPDGNVLQVMVEEAQSRSVGLFGGFATFDGALGGIEYEDRNFLGSARKVDAQVEVSKRGVRGEIRYTDPWFLWSDYELNASLFAINREEEGYERFTTGGRYALTKRFGNQGRDSFSFFGEATSTEITDSEIDTSLLGPTDYFSHFVGLSLKIDRRDKQINATRGWIFDTSYGIASSAIGSDIEFTKANLGFAYYHPLGIGTFRFRGRAGLIHSDDDEALPVDLRFFNGGRSSVRSFQERELGAIDSESGFSTGGEFFTVFNAEYVHPIRALNGLSIVPFLDAGNLLESPDEFGLNNLRYAYGIGLQYLTFIGPLRIDYGINPNPQNGENSGALHIGFGSEF